MTGSVTVDSTFQETLKTANGHGVTLCDANGKVIALALSLDQIRRYEIELAKARLPKEDIDRILATPGSYSMDQVFKLLEQS